ncbi:MAG TPA: efflux RND transporter periplasmic adaptor subunit [Terracidiphilus sp.]|nr:efflux RND transporter periplasmic adaptor subunit [Terracidiphilus sp.]
MNSRNRFILILTVIIFGAIDLLMLTSVLIWYLFTVRPSADLQLIGTVDANEVVVSSMTSGRIQKLLVDEGQIVKAGQLIAEIKSDELDASGKQVSDAQVFSTVGGMVNVRATRQGEVVAVGAAIVTIMDLTHTWIYAPLPETQADAVQLGDSLRVVMPSGETLHGTVVDKGPKTEIANLFDDSMREREKKTIQIKLLIDNSSGRFVPGMTAEVIVPKAKPVKQ